MKRSLLLYSVWRDASHSVCRRTEGICSSRIGFVLVGTRFANEDYHRLSDNRQSHPPSMPGKYYAFAETLRYISVLLWCLWMWWFVSLMFLQVYTYIYICKDYSWPTMVHMYISTISKCFGGFQHRRCGASSGRRQLYI